MTEWRQKAQDMIGKELSGRPPWTVEPVSNNFNEVVVTSEASCATPLKWCFK